MLREFTRKITNILMAMRPGYLFCLIVLIAVLLSEVICIGLSFLLTGHLRPDLLWAGFITPFLVSSIVGYFAIYIIDELRNTRQDLEHRVEERNQELLVKNRALESEIEERKQVENEVRRINDDLDRRVRERTADLRKAYEGVKKADQLKDSFLSSVSHELRTPLTSIRSFAEILLQYEDEAPETRREFTEIIQLESDRLTRLINDFLDLSKIQAGKMVYNDDLVSVEEIIREVAKTQHQLFREKSLRMNLDIDPDLPPVLVDRDRVQQVITNLLANAVKFSSPGGEVEARVEVLDGRRTGEPQNWIKVSILDQDRKVIATRKIGDAPSRTSSSSTPMRRNRNRRRSITT